MLLRSSLNTLARPAVTSLVCLDPIPIHPSIDSLIQRAASTLTAGFPKVAERVRIARRLESMSPYPGFVAPN
jgi:hypothetical protein